MPALGSKMNFVSVAVGVDAFAESGEVSSRIDDASGRRTVKVEACENLATP